MKKILLVFGTRPEAIKMAPLVDAFKKNKNFQMKVCVTGQHREMLDQVLELFQITPDYDLNLMKPGQTLNDVTSEVLTKIRPILLEYKPDLLFVHGDTATTFASSLAAYYEKIDVAHIEAGLRTGDIYSPWPEEINRKLTGSIARFHFAPTEIARSNLLQENVKPENIYVTGNTVIDSLMSVKEKITTEVNLESHLYSLFSFIDFSKNIILVTGHRRENFGSGMEEVCKTLSKLSKQRSDLEIIYPVHLNPNVQRPVQTYLSGHENIHLIEPLDYLPFTYLMMKAKIIITDSGGIQEEAPSLGKPVLVTRETTERPEAVDAGTVKLVGTSGDLISNCVKELLDNPDHYAEFDKLKNPYGDGQACKKIIELLEVKYEL